MIHRQISPEMGNASVIPAQETTVRDTAAGTSCNAGSRGIAPSKRGSNLKSRNHWLLHIGETDITIRTPKFIVYLADGGLNFNTLTMFKGIKGIIATPKRILWEIDRSRIVEYL